MSFEIEVDPVFVKILLEFVVIDVSLHVELAVVVERPIIPDLRMRVEVNADGPSTRQMGKLP